jgi:hypothetical protein
VRARAGAGAGAGGRAGGRAGVGARRRAGCLSHHNPHLCGAPHGVEAVAQAVQQAGVVKGAVRHHLVGGGGKDGAVCGGAAGPGRARPALAAGAPSVAPLAPPPMMGTARDTYIHSTARTHTPQHARAPARATPQTPPPARLGLERLLVLRLDGLVERRRLLLHLALGLPPVLALQQLLLRGAARQGRGAPTSPRDPARQERGRQPTPQPAAECRAQIQLTPT